MYILHLLLNLCPLVYDESDFLGEKTLQFDPRRHFPFHLLGCVQLQLHETSLMLFHSIDLETMVQHAS